MFHSLYPDLLKTKQEIYSDTYIYKAPPGAIIMLVEPRSIMPDVYEYVENNIDKFQLIYSFDSKLLQYDKTKLLIYGTTDLWSNEPKTKTVSMACSNKEYCEGHKIRKAIANKLKGKIDTYGRFDGGEFTNIYNIYSPYMFNIAIENYKGGYYFTEKLCNCFATKTIPIYFGSENIGKFFNLDGVIYINDLNEFWEDIDNVNWNNTEKFKEEYNKRLNAINDNYERVKQFANFNETFHRMYGGNA